MPTLHECQIARARAEAWEGKHPGSIRALPSNPRWERRLLRFLELSGVGIMVGDEGVEKTRAARLDRRIAWEVEDRVARQGFVYHFFPSYFSFSFRFFFEEGPSLELCAPRMLGSEDFFALWLRQGP